MPQLGPWELIIVLLIVVVVFGAGRLAEIGGALGKGIREFRSATKEGDDVKAGPVATATAAMPTTASVPAAGTSVAGTAPAAAAAGENTCPSCGTVNPATQAFCGQCGTRLAKAA